MFEQSILPNTRSRRPFTLVLTTAAEMVAISTAIVIPLFHVPLLTPPKLPVVLRLTRSVQLINMKPAKTTTTAPPAHRVVVPSKIFFAPLRIPTGIRNPQTTLAQEEAPQITSGHTSLMGD